jgi:hypothetical protein
VNSFRFAALFFAVCNVAAFAGVNISAPANGSTVGTSVQFIASANSDAGLPISSMMIYVDDQSRYLVYSNSLNTPVSLASGGHVAVVKSWDAGGNLYTSTVTFTCSAQSGGSGVSVSSPANGSSNGTHVHFAASASSWDQYPVTSMMIYLDDQAQFTAYSNSLDTYIDMGAGNHTAVIKSWNAAGEVNSQTVSFNASAGQSGGGSGAGVTVTSPTAGANLGSPVHFVASAMSADQNPITSMMIYVDSQSQYTVYASSLDTNLNIGAGNHTAVVKSWNSAGEIYTQTVPFSVGSSSSPPSSPSNGNVIANIQQLSGWDSCSACAGSQGIAQFSMTQHVGSPSLDGNTTQFWIGGNTPYTNAIWVKSLPAGWNATHFTYDLYFYMDNPNAAEALEFDVNVSYNGQYYVFGTQCSPRWSQTWDTWDENAGTWNSTGVGCPTFPANSWNHVTIELERTWDNQLHWIAISMNGTRNTIDRYVPSRPTGYNNGISVDFQMDGDYNQTDYSVWVDEMSLTYLGYQ